KTTPLSLLMTVRNEESNIKENFQKILGIENAPFEVVAIDNFSQDNSLSLLGVLKTKSAKMKISTLNQEIRYSVKQAQNIALKAASNDWVMVIPVSLHRFSENWILRITESLSEEKSVVMQYSNVENTGQFYNHHGFSCLYSPLK
ncbi:MAG: glycosyltransferase, partial [Desulfobacterales bacterium]|nr:glycosyltransferase [Desulfobacterales bacterium]